MAPKDEGQAEEAGGEEGGTRRANLIDQTVGNRVRMRRMLLGMSQERLGALLGLTFQQVQKYEKGVNRIGASRLYQLSQVLSVPISYFYEDVTAAVTGNPVQPGLAEAPAENYVVDFLATREGLELNKAFARITDPKARKAIIDFVKSMAPDGQ